MKKIIGITVLISTLAVYVSSCYNNKEDIVSLPKVSFLGEVVPIMTSSGCGCHNNVNANSSNNNAAPFSHLDTIFYDRIIARIDTFRLWVTGVIGHPGGGAVDLTPSQKNIIRAWIEQGPPYEGSGAVCVINGTMKYTTDILPIYNSTCKSSGCHGGRGPVLDYPKLVADKSKLINMMNSGGASGHPGGVIGLTSCTCDKFKAWIAAGMPQ